jgi:hypothetical protein
MNVSSWTERFVLLNPVVWRIRKFLWEVVLQAKVIAQRPLAGVAHAFVFWGFCAFGLITVNHLASAFGGRFLAPDHGFGRFYFSFSPKCGTRAARASVRSAAAPAAARCSLEKRKANGSM